MAEAIEAILSAIVLVSFSMIAGAIIYFLVKDYIKRNMRRKD
jgi:hypothetical protein